MKREFFCSKCKTSVVGINYPDNRLRCIFCAHVLCNYNLLDEIELNNIVIGYFLRSIYFKFSCLELKFNFDL